MAILLGRQSGLDRFLLSTPQALANWTMKPASFGASIVYALTCQCCRNDAAVIAVAAAVADSAAVQGRFASGFRRRLAALAAGLALALAAAAAPIELPFELDPQHSAILIAAEVNGKPATLILDTGASQTILDAALVGLSNVDLKMSRFAASGPGLRGEAMWAEARLKLGSRTWHNQRVVAMNLSALSARYRRPIHGILGQDILRQFDQVTINFRARTLVLGARPDLP